MKTILKDREGKVIDIPNPEGSVELRGLRGKFRSHDGARDYVSVVVTRKELEEQLKSLGFDLVERENE